MCFTITYVFPCNHISLQIGTISDCDAKAAIYALLANANSSLGDPRYDEFEALCRGGAANGNGNIDIVVDEKAKCKECEVERWIRVGSRMYEVLEEGKNTVVIKEKEIGVAR